VEAGSDTSASDVVTPGDGGEDARDAGSFCEQRQRQAPTPVFCADFDRAPVGFDWTSVNADTTDVIALDPVASSAPFSARIASGKEGCFQVGLARDFPTSTNEVHVDLRVRTGLPDGGIVTGYFGAVILDSAQGGAGCTVIFDLRTPTALGFAVQPFNTPGSSNDYVNATRYLLPNAWTRLQVDVTRPATGPRMLDVRLDGVAVANLALTYCPLMGPSSLSIGPNCGKPMELRFDDIVVTK
jgi:hypothetical protein